MNMKVLILADTIGGDDVKSKEDMGARKRWLLMLAGTSLGVYLGFRFILPLILPFLFAYFLAWIVRPVTDFFYRRLRIPRIIGGTVSLLVLSVITGTGLFFLCNTLMKQAIAFLKNIPIYLNLMADKLDRICENCDEMFGLAVGTARRVVDDNMLKMVDRVKTEVIPGITAQTLSMTIKIIGAIGVILIIFVSAVLIAKDLPAFRKKYENNDFYRDIHKITVKLADAGIAYLRSQLIIMIIVAIFCVLGLTLVRNDYALLLGIGIAVLDALPVLGSGIIFIPWSIIMLINGNIYAAAILITTYLVCQIVREVLEPKLIGKRIGLKPLFTLVAMYIGIKLFGIAGFILGPIGIIIIITVLKVMNEKTGEKTGPSYPLDKGDILE